jgi:hypothetical protein
MAAAIAAVAIILAVFTPVQIYLAVFFIAFSIRREEQHLTDPAVYPILATNLALLC